MASDPLLEIEGLTVRFPTPQGVLTAVDDISLHLDRGQRFGLVGESGSGKSVTAFSVLGLIDPPGEREAKVIRFEGQDLVHVTATELRRVRGRRIGLVMQDPLFSLSPVFTVGEQIAETRRAHLGESRRSASRQAVELLASVGIGDPERRARAYAHELSGGMRQRVAIAIALACEPSLLIADEPTTALDVTIQAQVLELLVRLSSERQMAVLMISHNLAVVAGFADVVAVMYAGRIVEQGTTAEMYARPCHPYTQGLLRSQPQLAVGDQSPLVPIRGTPPSPTDPPPGCAFHPRCELRRDRDLCVTSRPLLRPIATVDSLAACHFSEELVANKPALQPVGQ